MLHSKGNQMIGELLRKWEEKAQLHLSSIELQRSFYIHLKTATLYIYKSGLYTAGSTQIKNFFKLSDNCSLCKNDVDSLDHMLLRSPVITFLLDYMVRGKLTWITEIGFLVYNLSDVMKILGDVENCPVVNAIILLTK